jgi:hypothetical protein
VAVKHFEQFNQGQWQLSFSIFIPLKCIYAPAKYFSRFTLIQAKLLSNLGNKERIDLSGVNFFVEVHHQFASARCLISVKQWLIARGTKVAHYVFNNG